VFIPRRQAFTALAFQAAKDRGVIPPGTDVKFLLDVFYGYSLFRLITRQLDDDQVPERIAATIAQMADSGIPKPVRTQRSSKTSAGDSGALEVMAHPRPGSKPARKR
jgi:hypothetical protein